MYLIHSYFYFKAEKDMLLIYKRKMINLKLNSKLEISATEKTMFSLGLNTGIVRSFVIGRVGSFHHFRFCN